MLHIQVDRVAEKNELQEGGDDQESEGARIAHGLKEFLADDFQNPIPHELSHLLPESFDGNQENDRRVGRQQKDLSIEHFNADAP